MSHRSLHVRYYPQRLGRGARRGPMSPGQALHLADDEERAALARRTASERHWAPAIGAAGARRGRWRAVIRRLLRR